MSTLRQLARSLTARPEIGLGIAAFAGIALAAGFVRLPSLRRPAPAAKTAAKTDGSAAPTAPPVDIWGG